MDIPQQSNPSLWLFLKMFKFVTEELQNDFFKNRITADKFSADMSLVSGLAVKFKTGADSFSVSKAEFELLGSAYEAMKADIRSLTPESEMDHRILNNLLANYDEGFAIWCAKLHVEGSQYPASV